MRLTKTVRKQLLDQNEGFRKNKSYKSRNSSYTNHYEITGGQLCVRSEGKTSWADSRYNKSYECDDEQTHRFLRDHLTELNT